MSTPSTSARLIFSKIKGLLMDNENVVEIAAAEQYRESLETQEISELDAPVVVPVNDPTASENDFQISSADAYRASQLAGGSTNG